MGPHRSVIHVASTAPCHVFLTARVWDTVHFVFSCDLESKSANPLTVIVIPLHEKEVRELCVNKKSVPLLMDPRNLFCHHHSKLCGQIKDVMVHLGRFKNRLLIITSLFTQKNSAPEVKCVCVPPVISQNSLLRKTAC